MITSIIFHLAYDGKANGEGIYCHCRDKPQGEFVLTQTDWIFLFSSFPLEEL